jgi:hypothetical protein
MMNDNEYGAVGGISGRETEVLGENLSQYRLYGTVSAWL